MCVLPEYQGRGVGKQLLNALEHALRSQGVGKIYLLTSRGGVTEAFYYACGFYSSQKLVMLGKHL